MTNMKNLAYFVNHQPRFSDNRQISKILTDKWQSNEIFTDNRHVETINFLLIYSIRL